MVTSGYWTSYEWLFRSLWNIIRNKWYGERIVKKYYLPEVNKNMKTMTNKSIACDVLTQSMRTSPVATSPISCGFVLLNPHRKRCKQSRFLLLSALCATVWIIAILRFLFELPSIYLSNFGILWRKIIHCHTLRIKGNL